MYRDDQGGFRLPMHIRISPSPLLRRLARYLHCISPLPLLYSGLSWWMCVSGVLLLVAHDWYVQKRLLLNSYELLARSGSDWWLSCNGGEAQKVVLLPGSLLHPWFSVLRFRDGPATHVLVLTTDNVNPDAFRRLRVLLRFPG